MSSSKEEIKKSAPTSPRSAKGSAKTPKGKERKGPGSGKKKAKPAAKKKDEEPSAAAPEDTPDVPEYIVPLVFTTMTQEIFNCRVDEDVTPENPYKLIKKEDILQDLQARAAVSDFHPVKKVVMDYPGEELLLVFDSEFKYGQSFYLVTTEEWKEKILHPPEAPVDEEAITEEVVDEYVYKAPVSKPWVSLGSEAEIEDERVVEAKTKIKYMVSRVRREFGAPITFGDQNASSAKDGYIECTSFEDKKYTIRIKERDMGTQVVAQTKDSSTQTRWTFPRNASTQYEPRQFPVEEQDQHLSSKSMKDFLNSVSMRLELALQQNEIMNPFIDDWKSLAEDDSLFGGKSDSHLKEYQSFTDLHYSKDKSISCINWHPTIYGLLAVSITERLSYEDRLNLSGKLLLSPSLIIIWSFTDPIHPQLMLECPEEICCFQFCPTDSNIIAGGCINGQIVMWDISAYEEKLTHAKTGVIKPAAPKTGIEIKISTEIPLVRYCAVSSIENGHKELITDLHWLPDFYEVTKAGAPCENKSALCLQLVTCSPDCSVMFWDIRPGKPTAKSTPDRRKADEKQLENPHGVPTTFKYLDLAWKPLFKVSLPKAETSGEYSPMKISLRDEFTTYKMPAQAVKEKSQIQITEAKSEGGINYASLRAPSAKNSKTMEDFNTNIFVGTEDGELVYTNWKMEKDSDSGRMIGQKPTFCFKIHDGLVNTVQRSPFFKDIILTVGGWNFAIWQEGVITGPILRSCSSQKRYTSGHWSLSRAGVFFIGKEDGNVDIWDLLEKTHEASQTQNISTTIITCIRPWVFSSKQHFLALSDDNGTLHILEIPWTLRNPSHHELSIVQHYFEREVKHLEFWEQRKTFRILEKKEKELKELKEKTETAPVQKTKEQVEEDKKKEYEAYLELEKTTLAALAV
ncbi:dynein axonemal intermediate chain 3 [Ambystoma mexicanum]|uniref:dynein axonemal intermediate chain 3 n=1 Tax=Ambystoma mexicanum TaxID=8296 RepID=UPI0037E7AF45